MSSSIRTGHPLDWHQAARGWHEWAPAPEADRCPSRPDGKLHDRTSGPTPGICRYCHEGYGDRLCIVDESELEATNTEGEAI